MPRKKIEGPEHKIRILQTARDLFFAHPYDQVTTDMIAREARVSKSTLYTHVGDKKAILAEVVTEECKRIFDPKFEIPDEESAYRAALAQFAGKLLDLLADPNIIKFDQVMLSQALKAPDISMTFYHHAYHATYSFVEKVIQKGLDKGFIQKEQGAVFLTTMFLKCLEGRGYHKSLYGFGNCVTENNTDYIDQVLALTLGL